MGCIQSKVAPLPTQEAEDQPSRRPSRTRKTTFCGGFKNIFGRRNKVLPLITLEEEEENEDGAQNVQSALNQGGVVDQPALATQPARQVGPSSQAGQDYAEAEDDAHNDSTSEDFRSCVVAFAAVQAQSKAEHACQVSQTAEEDDECVHDIDSQTEPNSPCRSESESVDSDGDGAHDAVSDPVIGQLTRFVDKPGDDMHGDEADVDIELPSQASPIATTEAKELQSALPSSFTTDPVVPQPSVEEALAELASVLPEVCHPPAAQPAEDAASATLDLDPSNLSSWQRSGDETEEVPNELSPTSSNEPSSLTSDDDPEAVPARLYLAFPEVSQAEPVQPAEESEDSEHHAVSAREVQPSNEPSWPTSDDDPEAVPAWLYLALPEAYDAEPAHPAEESRDGEDHAVSATEVQPSNEPSWPTSDDDPEAVPAWLYLALPEAYQTEPDQPTEDRGDSEHHAVSATEVQPSNEPSWPTSDEYLGELSLAVPKTCQPSAAEPAQNGGDGEHEGDVVCTDSSQTSWVGGTNPSTAATSKVTVHVGDQTDNDPDDEDESSLGGYSRDSDWSDYEADVESSVSLAACSTSDDDTDDDSDDSGDNIDVIDKEKSSDDEERPEGLKLRKKPTSTKTVQKTNLKPTEQEGAQNSDSSEHAQSAAEDGAHSNSLASDSDTADDIELTSPARDTDLSENIELLFAQFLHFVVWCSQNTAICASFCAVWDHMKRTLSAVRVNEMYDLCALRNERSPESSEEEIQPTDPPDSPGHVVQSPRLYVGTDPDVPSTSYPRNLNATYDFHVRRRFHMASESSDEEDVW